MEDIPNDDGGAIYSAVSPDGRFAFISEEQSGKLTVVDLQKVATGSTTRDLTVSDFHRQRTGRARVLEGRDAPVRHGADRVAKSNYPHTCKPEGDAGGDMDPQGAVVTIDVAKAERNPGNAIVSSAPAACHPVRASLSPDGATLWVTARGSNAVSAFSTSKLLAGDSTAQIATIPVGTAPVPIVATPDGRYVLAGNSDRFGGPNKNQDLTIIHARRRGRRQHTGRRVSPAVQRDPERLDDPPLELRLGHVNGDRPAAIPSLMKRQFRASRDCRLHSRAAVKPRDDVTVAG